jgi:HK97 family phage portal protein
MGKLSERPAEELQLLFQPQDAAKPPDPQRMVYLRVGPQIAGVRVTMETASQVSVVWACIDVIAKAISASDWLVFERVGKKRRELADDRISYLLNTRPNDEMTAQSFKRAIGIALLSWGMGYAEIERDMANRPVALWPIAPDRVTPRRRPGSGRLYYEIRNDDGSVTEIEAADMYVARGPSINGLIGDNMIAVASGSIALAMATHKFAEAYFGNGTQLGGIMEYPGQLDDVTFDRLSGQFNGKHQGSAKAFKVGWIEQGMKYTPIESDAEKAQLVTARQQDIEDICRYWGVPPHKVQHLLRSTNNNIEHQGLEFTRDCLRPIAREFEQEATFKLFGARGPDRFIKIDLDWASEGDFKSRMEGLQIARNIGGLNGNEIREAIGYDDMGPDGDKYIVQGAMIELKDVGKAFDKAAPPAQPDPTGEPLQAWIGEIFARASRRQDNRRADLESKGLTDAMAAARKDAVAYLEQQLATVIPHLAAWAERDCEAALARHGIDVLTGTDPAASAAALINELKEAR